MKTFKSLALLLVAGVITIGASAQGSTAKPAEKTKTTTTKTETKSSKTTTAKPAAKDSKTDAKKDATKK